MLAYRKDLLEAAGLKPPTTMEDFVADALKLTDPAQEDLRLRRQRPEGPGRRAGLDAVQRQLGGSILDKDGKPALNSRANIESLIVYKELFDKAAPPGAADYDWGGREESFRQGLVAKMQTWSIGAPDYDDPKVSKIAGKVGIMLTPLGQGTAAGIRHRRLGLGINKDIDPKKQEAAWAFIKWVTSPAVHKELNLRGAGSYLRKSEMIDSELAREISVPAGDRDLVRARRRRLPAAHSAISGIAGSDRRRDQRGPGRTGRSQDCDGRDSGQGRGICSSDGGATRLSGETIAQPLRKASERRPGAG